MNIVEPMMQFVTSLHHCTRCWFSHGTRTITCTSCRWGKGGFVWCGEWSVHCSLSPLGQWTLHLEQAFFLFLFFGGGEGWGVKAKNFQVSDMFPKEFPIAPLFYLICFGKCCPPFTYIGGPKRRNSIFQNWTFYFGEPPQFHYFEWWVNQIGSLQKIKIKLHLGGTSSNE